MNRKEHKAHEDYKEIHVSVVRVLMAGSFLSVAALVVARSFVSFVAFVVP